MTQRNRGRLHRLWPAVVGVVLVVSGCGGAKPGTDGLQAQAAAPSAEPPTAPTVRLPSPTAQPMTSASPAQTPEPVPTPPSTPLPIDATYVVVQPGDTLAAIGQRYGLTLDVVLAANPQVVDRNRIRPGDRIAVPGWLFTGDVVTIVNGLGEASPVTVFQQSGAWAHDVSDEQNIGPLFTLERPTRITEIGGFVYGQTPLQVVIYPAVRSGDGLVPDRSTVLATFALPAPAPKTASYVWVAPNLVLPAGSYYALFAPQAGGTGSLLGGASDPFEYRAGSLTVWLSSGTRPTTQYTAVRILGRPSTRPTPTSAPAVVPSGETAQAISAMALGAYHTCVVTSTGAVKCWGWNNDGRLGDGTTIDRHTPTDVAGLSHDVTAVAAGNAHTCVLTNAGRVECWGDNSTFQLGNGTTDASRVPVLVTDLTSGVTALAAGHRHACALTSAGTVKCWGDGFHSRVPVDVPGVSGATAIAAGFYSTCALTMSGGVTCWGLGDLPALAGAFAPDALTPRSVSGLTDGVQAIAAGHQHACALTIEGGVKCWGRNHTGALGDGTLADRSVPVDVVGLAGGVTAIAAGYAHTCALLDTGAVRCWGHNEHGQLGTGTTQDSLVPVDVVGLGEGVRAIAAGWWHTCALLDSGAMKCWGMNAAGLLGNGRTSNSGVPVDVVFPAS